MFVTIFLVICLIWTTNMVRKHESALKENERLTTKLKNTERELEYYMVACAEVAEKRDFWKKLAKDNGLVLDPDMPDEEWEKTYETAKVIDLDGE